MVDDKSLPYPRPVVRRLATDRRFLADMLDLQPMSLPSSEIFFFETDARDLPAAVPEAQELPVTERTVTCHEAQPRSWYETANTLGWIPYFAEADEADEDPYWRSGVMSNPPPIYTGGPADAPYHGRYARRR